MRRSWAIAAVLVSLQLAGCEDCPEHTFYADRWGAMTVAFDGSRAAVLFNHVELVDADSGTVTVVLATVDSAGGPVEWSDPVELPGNTGYGGAGPLASGAGTVAALVRPDDDLLRVVLFRDGQTVATSDVAEHAGWSAIGFDGVAYQIAWFSPDGDVLRVRIRSLTTDGVIGPMTTLEPTLDYVEGATFGEVYVHPFDVGKAVISALSSDGQLALVSLVDGAPLASHTYAADERACLFPDAQQTAVMMGRLYVFLCEWPDTTRVEQLDPETFEAISTNEMVGVFGIRGRASDHVVVEEGSTLSRVTFDGMRLEFERPIPLSTPSTRWAYGDAGGLLAIDTAEGDGPGVDQLIAFDWDSHEPPVELARDSEPFTREECSAAGAQ